MLKKVMLALLAIAVVGGGYLWLNRDRFVAEFNQQRAADAQRFHAAGIEFGRNHDQQACLDKALSDFDTQCTGFECTVRYGKFLKACLDSSSVNPAFCQGVPAFNEELSEEDKNWARQSCWGRDIRGEGCRLLMRQQQLFCSSSEAAVPGRLATGQ
ncbi:hypothetical protein GCM10011352_40660 [Marinobacterium zhoushanense]|uniref:Uncharacterized protein n=1 Tax=Marinobacterium zhoushanense TaxID=1679163 RepID=A0ABQ1KTQ6_9GAMM|nr:hypothetical protein [Marinobacterium zhoushanense]GGC10062.1 hypothetical protein GCM10011352_40660 [Marinobacterium zhoushanense]